MARSVALVVIAVAVSACTTAPSPSLPPSNAPPTASMHVQGQPTPAPSAAPTIQPQTETPGPSVSAVPVDLEPVPDPPSGKPAMTEYERTLESYLRPDARIDCAPRRSDLPPGATAAVECHLDGPLVDRVAVYGFAAGSDLETGDQAFLDRAALAYLDRMDQEGVLGSVGDCLAGTPQDTSWEGPEADAGPSNVYPQVDYDGRRFSIHRYGCFVNAHGVANVRATCGDGAYVGVLGRTARLDELTAWALAWPDPDELSFPMPGICAGQHRITY
ncbi:MAG TPA: hypothetical protein VF119_01295 [Candidatus Limnocylindrales bacterium]